MWCRPASTGRPAITTNRSRSVLISSHALNRYLRSSDGSVEHTGDNRTGEGDGDDEALKVELGKVPADVQKIAVSVTIHEGEARRQSSC